MKQVVPGCEEEKRSKIFGKKILENRGNVGHVFLVPISSVYKFEEDR